MTLEDIEAHILSAIQHNQDAVVTSHLQAARLGLQAIMAKRIEKGRADALTEALFRKIATQYCEYDKAGRSYNILRYECEADFFNCIREILAASQGTNHE